MRTGHVVEVVEVEPAWVGASPPGVGGPDDPAVAPAPPATADDHAPVAAVAQARHR